MLENIRTIYFDYDGTIHNSIKIYAPAFIKAYEFLVANQKAEARTWKEEEISKWLGYTSQKMWESFMKDLEEPYKKEASQIIGQEMVKQIQLGKAELYPHALKVLETLKKRGYQLVFLSNCGIKYMEASSQAFDLDQYFDDMHCAEAHDYIPKEDILARIKGHYPDEQVIVGDRFHDIQAGVKNKIESIWCQYGFGQVQEAQASTTCIKDIVDLLDLL